MASSSASHNQPDLNTTPDAQADVWSPSFLTCDHSITVNDTVVHNYMNAVAITMGLLTPRDERTLNAKSDMDLMRDAMALSAQATTVTSSMARRLYTRSGEAHILNNQALSLQRKVQRSIQKIRALREENRVLKEMVDAYARGVTPRVVALEGLEEQIREQLEKLQNDVQSESAAGPSNSSQDATME